MGIPKRTIRSTSAYHTIDENIRLIAHRGYTNYAPENTLASIEAAAEAGYWGCEFDVRRTADGQWVLLHDKNLLRTTGMDALISKTTFADLQKLDCGTGSQGERIKIPTLEEALLVCNNYNMAAFIEVKSTVDPATYAKEIFEIIQKSQMEKKSTVLSFSQDFTRHMKHLAQSIPVALLAKNLTPSQIAFAEENQIGLDIRYDVPKRTQPLLQEATDKKLLYSCYMVNDSETVYDLFVLGLRTFTTDTVLPEHLAIMNTSVEMPSLPIFRILLTENYYKRHS